MSDDRLTKIRIRGLRAIDDIELPLNGLQVLIGENGSGKSSIIEAFELLRKAAATEVFLQDSVPAHGGLKNLLRSGASELLIGVRIESETEPTIDYSFGLALEGNAAVVSREVMLVNDEHGVFPVILRDRVNSMVFESNGAEPVVRLPGDLWSDARSGAISLQLFDPETMEGDRARKLNPRSPYLSLSSFGQAPPHQAMERMLRILRAGAVHVPFDVRPLWTAKDPSTRSRARTSGTLRFADAVGLFGENLLSCYHALRNGRPEVWQRVLSRVRSGLGDDIADIALPIMEYGEPELLVKFKQLRDPIPASSLSDGQLSFLLFVALSELAEGRSFLAIDEPEQHMHPGLLREVVGLLEQMGKSAPVVVTTHADQLLDSLSDPLHSVILCELNGRRAMRLLRPEPEQLAKWLEDYQGIGSIRAQGYIRHLMNVDVTNGATS